MQTGIRWKAIFMAVVAVLLSLRATPVQAFGLLIFAAILQHYRETALPLKEDPLTGNQPALSEYDFIIVGAGSSGTLLANRLTENPNWKVLLIEAGGEDTVVVDVPIIVDYFQQTDYNWGYKMEWEPNVCLGNTEQRCLWPRGKVLGGTSSINYMIYTRGNPKDYDEWEAAGNTGWGWNSVLPYFLKTERCGIPEYNSSEYHNFQGLLPVERVPYNTPLLDIFLNAGKEMGYDIIDYNNPNTHIGFSALQANMHRGRRTSGATAFLRPIRSRRNLHILAEARATRVLFDQTTMRATAVELVRRRKWRVIRARKEVILSAGAINTPHILMHSGIGPQDHLTEKGIRTLRDLKVGYNLNEHVATAGLTFLVNQSIGLTLNAINQPAVYAQWLNGEGPATIPGGVEALAYIKTKYNNDRNRPDMEFIFASGALNSDGGATIRGGMGISDETYNAMWGTIPQRHAWTVWPMILNPRSRGRIMLRDNNPFHWPLMHGNYFENEIDLKVIIEGIKAVVRMSETKAFQQVGSTLHRAPPPRCAHIEFATDPYWECLIRTITTTLHHQSGTCKMGPATDPDAVVDPQLRVYGTTSLRVVDASIAPKLPAAHTNAVSYMIAEKAADLIKDTWKEEFVPPSVPETPSQPDSPQAETPSTPLPPSLTLPTPTGTPPLPTQRPPSGQPQPIPGYPNQPQGSGRPNVPGSQPNPPSGYPSQQPSGNKPPVPFPGQQPQQPQRPLYPQPPPPQQPSYPQQPQQPSYPQPPQQPSYPQPPQQPSYPQPPQQPSYPQPPQQPSYPQQPQQPQYPQPPQQPSYPQPPQQPSYPQPPQQPSYPQPPQQPSYPQPPQQPSYPENPQQPSYPQPPTYPQQPSNPQPIPENEVSPCPYPLVPVKHPSIPVLPPNIRYVCQDPTTIPSQYPKLFLQPGEYSNEVRSLPW